MTWLARIERSIRSLPGSEAVYMVTGEQRLNIIETALFTVGA
jgi:hypothetical protein